MRVLWRVIVKEILQLRRDRKMIPMLLAAPLIQLVVFGFAANLDVNDIPLLLLDRDRSAASRALADAFVSSGHFRLAGTEDDAARVEDWLVTGRAQVVLVIDSGYGADRARGTAPAVQVIADGTDSNSAVVGLAYASRIVASEGALAARARIARSGAGQVELVPRVWYNPDLLSRWFYLPAILAMVLLMITMILPSMAVVREKEIGTLEQLIVTPLAPWQLIVGKLLPFAVLGTFDLLLVIAAIVKLFGLPLAGSLLDLVLMSLPFLVCMLALGLFVSTLAANQQQAMMLSMFLVMVPMIYLSGLIFPIDNMPRAMQWITVAIPLRYYADILRGVFLRGSGFEILWRETLILCGFALGFLALASVRFRKSLD